MTCACCQVLPCCNGNECNDLTRSQCVHGGGSSNAGTCAVGACLNQTGKTRCVQDNQCGCRNKPYATQHWPGFTCNCTELGSLLGANNNGCRWYYCEQCVGGFCVNGCPSPRSCCAGTCCPLPQQCVNETCVDKCAAGTTFCAGAGSSYDCCAAGEKCCGSAGCLSTQQTSGFSVNVADDSWTNTGLTIPAGATVSITATGSVQWRLPIRDNIGPDGTGLYPIDGPCQVMAVTHMRLIGRVGGVMFSVGSSYTGQPGSGALELRQNDTCSGDNEGFYTGTVSYGFDPCPGFTPAAVGEPIVYGSGEQAVAPRPGPGAELKALLKMGGIVASPTCSCNARAAQMDSWGEWECLKHLPEICGWLKEEAEKRGLWFSPPAGMALILAAISLSALKRPFRGNSK